MAFQQCVNKYMKKLEGPVDENSLAGQRLYDKETAVSRCARKCVEGFGCPNMRKLLKWGIVGVIVYLILSLLVEGEKEAIPAPAQVGGVTMKDIVSSEFSFSFE